MEKDRVEQRAEKLIQSHDHTGSEANIISSLPVTWENMFSYCLRQFRLKCLLISIKSVLMQKTTKFCKAITLQLKKNKWSGKKKVSWCTNHIEIQRFQQELLASKSTKQLDETGFSRCKGHPAAQRELWSRGQWSKTLGSSLTNRF